LLALLFILSTHVMITKLHGKNILCIVHYYRSSWSAEATSAMSAVPVKAATSCPSQMDPPRLPMDSLITAEALKLNVH